MDVNIEIVLAARDENGNCTDGIDYIDMSNDAAYCNYGLNRNNTNGVDKADLYANRWDPSEYYNIYVVTEIDDANCPSPYGINGFAHYASSHSTNWDGTYIRYCKFSEPTLAHEIGHALNLYHTFQGGDETTCPNDSDCTTDGDKCCDTPPHFQNWGCPCGTNSCDNNSKNSEYTKNLMSYNSCKFGFTNDQKSRMRDAISNTKRFLSI